MRFLAFAVLVAGATLAVVPTARCAPAARTTVADSPAAQAAWRRTADGWRRRDIWRQRAPRSIYRAPLDPLVVAAGQLLVSVWALLAMAPQRQGADSTRSRDQPEPSAANR